MEELDNPQTQLIEEQTSEAIPEDSVYTISFDTRKTLISLFIIWHIFAVSVWLLSPGAVNFYLSKIVAPYMQITGFWQNWTMFSPNPLRDDYYVQAQITYADGVTRNWNIPRMHDMGMIEKYQKERFRKMVENAGGSSNKTMYPFLARYAMIENDRGPATYPATVKLVRYWRFIAPPNPGWRTPDFAPGKMASYTYSAPILGKDNH
jgi:hypothetical protein